MIPATPSSRVLNFELALFTAQTIDTTAGDLQVGGALGGPLNLSQQPFSVGINDLVLNPSTTLPTVTPPNPPMTLFSAWADPTHTPAQQAVARGEALFNTRPITISGVAGLNDALGLPSFRGTCTTCHNTPNVGNHSVAAPLNIGIADASRRTPDLPLPLIVLSRGENRQPPRPGRRVAAAAAICNLARSTAEIPSRATSSPSQARPSTARPVNCERRAESTPSRAAYDELLRASGLSHYRVGLEIDGLQARSRVSLAGRVRAESASIGASS